MSTPANIAELDNNGRLRIINVAMDGDLSETGVAPVLLTAYRNPKKIDQLMKLGNLSHLGFTPKPANAVKEYGPDWASHLSQGQIRHYIDSVDNYTQAFGRDWGRDGEKTAYDKTQTPDPDDLMTHVIDHSSFDGKYDYLYDARTNMWLVSEGNNDSHLLSEEVYPDDLAKVEKAYTSFERNPENPRLPKLDSHQIHQIIHSKLYSQDDGLVTDRRFATGELEANATGVKSARRELELGGLSADHKAQLKQAIKLDSDPKHAHHLRYEASVDSAKINNLKKIDKYIKRNPEAELYPADLNINKHLGDKLSHANGYARGFDKLNRFAQHAEHTEGVERLNHFAHSSEMKEQAEHERDSFLKDVPSGRDMQEMRNSTEEKMHEQRHSTGVKPTQKGSAHASHETSDEKAVDPSQISKAIDVDPYLRKELCIYNVSQADRYLTADYNRYANLESGSNYREPMKYGIPVSSLKNNTDEKEQMILNKYSWKNRQGTGLFTAERVNGSADTFRPMTTREVVNNIKKIKSSDPKVTNRILHPEHDRLAQKIQTGDILKDVKAAEKNLETRHVGVQEQGDGPIDVPTGHSIDGTPTYMPEGSNNMGFDNAFSHDLQHAMGVESAPEHFRNEEIADLKHHDRKQYDADTAHAAMHDPSDGSLYDRQTDKPLGKQEIIKRFKKVGKKAKNAHQLSEIIRKGDGIVKSNQKKRGAEKINREPSLAQLKASLNRMVSRSPRTHKPTHNPQGPEM